MENRLVSIALTTYNGEKFLRQQLQSIYAQTHKNIEVIVCDDCSTDNTPEILQEFSVNYGLKYYINERNLGFVKNFERAISLTKADFIALSDQDDFWIPNKIEILLKEIGNYSLVCSDSSLINEAGQQIAASLKKYQDIFIPENDLFNYLIYNNFVTGCTCLFKRELLYLALPIPGNFGYHDWWLALAASQQKGIKFVDKPLVLYRQHSNNDTGAIQSKSIGNTIYGGIKNLVLNQKKRKYYNMKLQSLHSLLQSQLVTSEDEKNFVAEALSVYDNKLNTFIHYKAFRIAYSHQKYIFPRYSFIKKQISSFGWLFN